MVLEDEKKLNRYKRIFEKCDTNQDNLISFRELTNFLQKKKNTTDLPYEQIKYVFRLEAKEGSKTVNFDEFVKILENPDIQCFFERCVNNYIKLLVPQQKHDEPHPVKKIVPKGRSVKISYQVKTEISAPDGRTRRSSTESAELHLMRYTEEEDEEEEDEETISYMEQLTCCPPPIAMILISILEFIFYITDESYERNSTLYGTGITAKIFIYDPSKRNQAWRYLTYMFVHIGYLHIVVNLAVQLLLGIPLEMVHKWWRVLLIYFAGVLAGSLATSITDPTVKLAGASGGVYSLLTAHISTIIMNWNEMAMPYVQISIYGIIIVCDLGSSIYDRYFLKVNNHIGYAAHFGGAVAGLLVGIYILKNLNVRKCEKYLWWAAVIIYAVLMIIAIFLNIFLPWRYPA